MLAYRLDPFTNPYERLQYGDEGQRSPDRQKQVQIAGVLAVGIVGADPNEAKRPKNKQEQSDFGCHTTILTPEQAIRCNEVKR